MSTTLKPIAFFSDEIEIEPHSATHADHVGRRVSIREFAKGRPCSLSEVVETGELRAVICSQHGNGRFSSTGEFMEGPERF
jgi:hypothetical protein